MKESEWITLLRLQRIPYLGDVTADITSSYHREVFAVPDWPTDKMGIGCNNFIKARAITSAEDIIYMLNWYIPQRTVSAAPVFVDLNPEEERIMKILRQLRKAELDALVLVSKLPDYKEASHLLKLELNQLILLCLESSTRHFDNFKKRLQYLKHYFDIFITRILRKYHETAKIL